MTHRQDREQRGQRPQGRQQLAHRRRHQPRQARHRSGRGQRGLRRQRQHGRRPRRGLPARHDPDPRRLLRLALQRPGAEPEERRRSLRGARRLPADADAALLGQRHPQPRHRGGLRPAADRRGLRRRRRRPPTGRSPSTAPARWNGRRSPTPAATSASIRWFARARMSEHEPYLKRDRAAGDARRLAALCVSLARRLGRGRGAPGSIAVTFNGAISPRKLPRTRHGAGRRADGRQDHRRPTAPTRRCSTGSSSTSTATG